MEWHERAFYSQLTPCHACTVQSLYNDAPIGLEHVISEWCYKGKFYKGIPCILVILPIIILHRIQFLKKWEPQHDRVLSSL